MKIKTNFNTIFIEPRNILDTCIIRYDKKHECLIYDYWKLIEGLMSLGMTNTEAHDHVNFNIIGMEGNKFFPLIDESKHD